MSNTLMGIPLAWLALPCLGIATLYYFFWPKPQKTQVRPVWVQVVLRWFHSLVWVLLAAACVLWGGGSSWGKVAAALAGVVYLVFLGVMAAEKNGRFPSPPV